MYSILKAACGFHTKPSPYPADSLALAFASFQSGLLTHLDPPVVARSRRPSLLSHPLASSSLSAFFGHDFGTPHAAGWCSPPVGSAKLNPVDTRRPRDHADARQPPRSPPDGNLSIYLSSSLHSSLRALGVPSASLVRTGDLTMALSVTSPGMTNGSACAWVRGAGMTKACRRCEYGRTGPRCTVDALPACRARDGSVDSCVVRKVLLIISHIRQQPEWSRLQPLARTLRPQTCGRGLSARGCSLCGILTRPRSSEHAPPQGS